MVSTDNNNQTLQLVVNRITSLTPGVKEFELVPGDELSSLPPAEPGAHIKLKIGNGNWRAYSVVNYNDPDKYIIAVRLNPGFSEGSQFMHDFVYEDDEIEVMPPENGFALAENAKRALLIAGGIGITPIIGLGKRMKELGMEVEFHYVGRDKNDMAYLDEVAEIFGQDVTFYFTDAEGIPALSDMIGEFQDGTHFYACGPEPMLHEARQICIDWPTDNVHFELFINPPDGAAKIAEPAEEFEIKLARSGKVLTVPADKTILDVLQTEGIELPSVCRSGFCGTCVVPLLGGEADHRDTVLSDAERKDRIQTCCSRAAKGAQLILDR